MTTPEGSLLEDLREELGTGEPTVAHIVKDPEKVQEAYIMGTPLEALCGHVWVPTKPVKGLPLCEMCKELADAFMNKDEGGVDGVEGVF